MKKILLSLIFVSSLAPALFSADKLVLFDFEKEEEFKAVKPEGEFLLDPWVFNCELSGEHATSGKKSLKVLPKAGAKWLVFNKLPANNWSSFDVIKFDIFNPSKNRFTVSFALSDWQALPCGEEYKCMGYPMHQNSGVLKQGEQTIEFPLKKLATIDSRFMFVEDTRLIAIGFDNDKTPFFIDNIRLEKKKVEVKKEEDAEE